MEEFVKWLSDTYSIDLRIAYALFEKGIDNEKVAQALFEPKPENLVHWSGLPDIYRILQKIKDIVNSGSAVLVWGHEDADGFTSVAILKKALELAGVPEVFYYVPSKKKEGHGLSLEGLNYARNNSVNYIVTVDCCSSDQEKVELARKFGIEVHITDHHELPAKLPNTVLVNPKRGGNNFKYLAGVGVALKVAWAILEEFKGQNLKDIISTSPEFFIYSAIGTIADRVPLFSENRIIADLGINLLNESPPLFVETLKEISQSEPTLDLIISVISSGSREDHLHRGVELLISNEKNYLTRLIQENLKAVSEYRERVETLMKNILATLRTPRKYILIDLKDAEPKYLGAIASRLKDSFNLPAIVMGRKGNEIVAEVRVPYGVNSLELLEYLSPYLKSYGGHKAASGFSSEEFNLAEIIEGVEIYFRSHFKPEIKADFEVDSPDQKLIEDLKRIGKLGVNMRVLMKYKKDILDELNGAREGSLKEGDRILVETGSNGLNVISVL